MSLSLTQLTLIQAGLSVLPVILFLSALQLIDTYKLVTLRRVAQSVVVGAGVAALCFGLNSALYRAGVVSPAGWARFGIPWLEESVKALYVIWLLRSNRVAFMVDTAIAGFAVGAGFAVLENLTYLPIMSEAGLAVAAIRGLGTAMMHGGTTAIFGTISSHRTEILGSRGVRTYLPGLLIAGLIHTLYNQPFLAPVTHAITVLIALPAVIALIFLQSEKALERWMGTKLDKDIDLLQSITTGTFSSSHVGVYLQSLETRFDAEMRADMLCYLQLTLELSARAKGDMLRREMGFEVAPDPSLAEQLKEFRWLESRLGKAGQMALAPLVGQNRRDVWELQQLSATTAP